MENIFENAYFGKPYKTRDGKKAIFSRKNGDGTFDLETEDSYNPVRSDGSFLYTKEGYESDNDIVSEWTAHDIDYTEMIKRAQYEYSGYTKDKKFFMKGYELGFKYALELYGK